MSQNSRRTMSIPGSIAYMQEKIKHIVVLMLENRSFDSMLGRLYPKSAQFNGLSGSESNFYTDSKGTKREVNVWNTNDPGRQSSRLDFPSLDPGESFTDMNEQLFGNSANPPAGTVPTMSGFAQSYYTLSSPNPPDEIMHHYLPEQLPALSTLAKNYAVSDAWFASAPCQTNPNRFFLHTGTALGYENNFPFHFPYSQPTIFTRFNKKGIQNGWKIYCDDIPLTGALTDLWPYADQFVKYDTFQADAASGNLAPYSFIECNYMYDHPNDQHPPYDVRFGDALIADVYNKLQASPCWKNTLLIVIYDEHGGTYDHVPPPSAPPPEPPRPGQVFAFDRFGVRVPAVIVSPYIRPGTIFRAPAGSQPYDHTSVIATLRNCFDLGGPLTNRDAKAPDLSSLLTLTDDALNLGAPVTPLPLPSGSGQQFVHGQLTFLQEALHIIAAHFPNLSGLQSPQEKEAAIQQHIQNVSAAGPLQPPPHNKIEEAGDFIKGKIEGFFSKL